MSERAPFQVRLRDLLAAVGLFGVSLGLGLAFCRVAEAPSPSLLEIVAVVLSYLGSSAAFGGSIACLVQKRHVGLVFGLLSLYVLAYVKTIAGALN